jgi:uncharacterized protein YqfA (UPF0365 family)
VGEGIVKAIGSAASHKEIMANPNLISQAVLNNSLDSQTAFEIVSIDVAEIDVGANVGANLQAEQATADLRVAQAQAETRRANAVALAQENAAKVEENRALLVLAESEVPRYSRRKNGCHGLLQLAKSPVRHWNAFSNRWNRWQRCTAGPIRLISFAFSIPKQSQR